MGRVLRDMGLSDPLICFLPSGGVPGAFFGSSS